MLALIKQHRSALRERYWAAKFREETVPKIVAFRDTYLPGKPLRFALRKWAEEKGHDPDHVGAKIDMGRTFVEQHAPADDQTPERAYEEAMLDLVVSEGMAAYCIRILLGQEHPPKDDDVERIVEFYRQFLDPPLPPSSSPSPSSSLDMV